MNAQERRLALLSLLSLKAEENKVKVIETFDASLAKTKAMAELLKAVDAKKPILAITRDEKTSILGAWNLEQVHIVNVEYLNPHALLKYTDLILSEASLAHLYAHFAR